TGKTTLGRLLAKAANCVGPVDGEPCNECASCVAFNEGRAMDFVEQDAASHNSVDDIRQLRENVALSPMAGGRKVYLLDEVHMLSTGARNALLKTLEEPPPHIVFVLATTEAHKLDATIISRCQRFDLRRIPMTAVVERLGQICEGEGVTLDQAALEDIARGASGSLRDAINGLEQVVTYYGNAPAIEQVREALGLSTDIRSGELARLALAGDLGGGLKLIATVRDDGADMKNFNKQVVDYLRNLLLAKSGALEALDLPREAAEEVKQLASKLERGEIVRVLKAFAAADFRDDSQASLPLELAFVESAGRAAAPRETTPVVAQVAQPVERRAEPG
ncbi:MAG: DNA polymerase III subunit gamma/tau, partial [Burkholderiales bacterium]